MAMSSKSRTVAPQATNGMAGFSIVTKTLTEHGFFSNKFFNYHRLRDTQSNTDALRYVASGWQRV